MNISKLDLFLDTIDCHFLIFFLHKRLICLFTRYVTLDQLLSFLSIIFLIFKLGVSQHCLGELFRDKWLRIKQQSHSKFQMTEVLESRRSDGLCLTLKNCFNTFMSCFITVLCQPVLELMPGIFSFWIFRCGVPQCNMKNLLPSSFPLPVLLPAHFSAR